MKNTQRKVLLYLNVFAVVCILDATLSFALRVSDRLEFIQMMQTMLNYPIIQSVHLGLFKLSCTLKDSGMPGGSRVYIVFNYPALYAAILTVINFSLLFIIFPIYNRKKKATFLIEKSSGEFIKGTVREVLPDDLFKVELENGYIISANISETLQLNHFQPGDKVTVERLYDLDSGRITERTG